MNRTLDPIVWSEGLLISAQHFQQQDLFHASQLNSRISSISSYAWGVRDLEIVIDYTQVEDGELIVHHGDIIFPSGIHANWGEKSYFSLPLRKKLPSPYSTSSKQGNDRLSVYAAITRSREGVANIEKDQNTQTSRRFVAYNRNVPEYSFAQTEAVNITFARPVVQIVFDRQNNGDMEYLKIAEIYRTASDKKWKIDNDFFPSAIHFHYAKVLTDRLRTIFRLFHDHTQTLRNALSLPRSRGTQRLSIPKHEEPFLFHQYHIVRQITLLIRTILLRHDISPYNAYHTLCIAAELCSDLQEDESLSYEPVEYSHSNISACFRHIYSHLKISQSHTIQEVICIKMKRQTNGQYHAAIPKIHIGNTESVYIKIRPIESMDPSQTQQWQSLTKVASPSTISKLFRAALPGIVLTREQIIPEGITSLSHEQLFQLDCKNSVWEKIENELEIIVAPPTHDKNICESIDLLLKIKPQDETHA